VCSPHIPHDILRNRGVFRPAICFTDDAPAWSAVGIGNDVPEVLNVHICVRNLKKWLQNCLENHGDCRHDGVFRTPGCLLDLASFESGHIKFINSSEMKDIKYTALSHCWGTAQAKTTTRANVLRAQLPNIYSRSPENLSGRSHDNDRAGCQICLDWLFIYHSR